MCTLIHPSILTSTMLGFPLCSIETCYAQIHPFNQPTSPHDGNFLYNQLIAYGSSICVLDHCMVCTMCTHSFIHLFSHIQCVIFPLFSLLCVDFQMYYAHIQPTNQSHCNDVNFLLCLAHYISILEMCVGRMCGYVQQQPSNTSESLPYVYLGA